MADRKDVVVVGGGPAGITAAGTAGKRGLNAVLVEKNDKLGRKLLITGKGRCNITNDADIEELIRNIPVNGKFLYSAFYTFSNYQLISLLNSLGLKTKVERGGRVFPVSNRAADVLKALEKYLDLNNVSRIKGRVVKILQENGRISGVKLKNGRIIYCNNVVVATGGKSYPATGSTGDGYNFARDLNHSVTPLSPSLVPIVAEEEWVKEAQGLSLKNIAVKVYENGDNIVYEDFGELLFTHFGVSGPVILSASSHIRDIEKKSYKIIIDLKPALSCEQLDRRIQRDFKKYSRKYYGNSLGDLLPAKLIPIIIRLSSISYDKMVNQITREERMGLVNLLKNLIIHIKGFRPIAEAIVTSGGVDVDEIDPGTMESKLVRGLFFSGEVLDVDGYTGGFNLQIAFSTGYLAGINVE